MEWTDCSGRGASFKKTTQCPLRSRSRSPCRFSSAIPRPLPEPVDDKTVAEINAPGWLNGPFQSARDGKFEHKIISTTDTKLGSMFLFSHWLVFERSDIHCAYQPTFGPSAHDAVLRLRRPGEVRTYMVEPQFPKRADAKNAVCLASLAAGVGAYVRSVSGALETKTSPETKMLVLENIHPFLTTEYGKHWPNKLPEVFEYTKNRDGTHRLYVNSAERLCDAGDLYAPPACGCVLTLKLRGEPEEHEKRSWTVPADFCNRNDAKIAVATRVRAGRD